MYTERFKDWLTPDYEGWQVHNLWFKSEGRQAGILGKTYVAVQSRRLSVGRIPSHTGDVSLLFSSVLQHIMEGN